MRVIDWCKPAGGAGLPRPSAELGAGLAVALTAAVTTLLSTAGRAGPAAAGGETPARPPPAQPTVWWVSQLLLRLGLAWSPLSGCLWCKNPNLTSGNNHSTPVLDRTKSDQSVRLALSAIPRCCRVESVGLCAMRPAAGANCLLKDLYPD